MDTPTQARPGPPLHTVTSQKNDAFQPDGDVLLIKELAIEAPTRPKKTAGLPPINSGVMKVAEYPSHELVMLNPSASVERRENWRGSSSWSSPIREPVWSLSSVAESS